jgi:hypothetical protein
MFFIPLRMTVFAVDTGFCAGAVVDDLGGAPGVDVGGMVERGVDCTVGV